MLSRYYHTLRTLRPIQIYGRIWHRLRRPRPDLRPAPNRRTVQKNAWAIPGARKPMMLSPERVRFLNEEREIKSAADWNAEPQKKNWLLYPALLR